MVQLACIIIDLISTNWSGLAMASWAGLLLSNLVVPYETTKDHAGSVLMRSTPMRFEHLTMILLD